jgi:putative hydrolase of the HAD superfamily
MKVRAVIFDIYNTLLEVGPAPEDAEKQWPGLWREYFGNEPRLRLSQFKSACDRVIAREHEAARAAGVSYPEVFWPGVLGEVLPEFTRLETSLRRAFMRGHARLTHTLQLFRDAPTLLRRLHERDVLLGLASNSQPYTLPELEAEFAPSGLSAGIFHPSLRFLSFENGFSKPDPHVFRLLAARLRALGITTAESLVVGDRKDNDVEPARAQGFQTWLLGPSDTGDGGDWKQLAQRLEQG